jgi:hypothetical protein
VLAKSEEKVWLVPGKAMRKGVDRREDEPPELMNTWYLTIDEKPVSLLAVMLVQES